MTALASATLQRNRGLQAWGVPVKLIELAAKVQADHSNLRVSITFRSCWKQRSNSQAIHKLPPELLRGVEKCLREIEHEKLLQAWKRLEAGLSQNHYLSETFWTKGVQRPLLEDELRAQKIIACECGYDVFQELSRLAFEGLQRGPLLTECAQRFKARFNIEPHFQMLLDNPSGAPHIVRHMFALLLLPTIYLDFSDQWYNETGHAYYRLLSANDVLIFRKALDHVQFSPNPEDARPAPFLWPTWRLAVNGSNLDDKTLKLVVINEAIRIISVISELEYSHWRII